MRNSVLKYTFLGDFMTLRFFSYLFSIIIIVFLSTASQALAQGSEEAAASSQTKDQSLSTKELRKFCEKIMWIQVGNQITDIDEAMLCKLTNTGFGKIVLLHSSINEYGYFPRLRSIVKRAHARGIKVAVGTLVFKDTFQKRYWQANPSLRHCGKDGKYTDHKFYHYQICPNNPKNHEYIASLMLRKASESGADEIHIDYEIIPCYCPYCLEKFKCETGLDARSVSGKDPVWMAWRSRCTRDFFALLARKARSASPPIAISATAPIIGHKGGFSAYETDLRYEDLTMYTDEYEPMIYLSVKQDPKLAGEHLRKIASRVKGRKVVPGIIINEEFTTQIKSADRVKEELLYLQEKGACKIAVFEIRYLNEELTELFKNI